MKKKLKPDQQAFIDRETQFLERFVEENDYGSFHARLATEMTAPMAFLCLLRLVWNALQRMRKP